MAPRHIRERKAREKLEAEKRELLERLSGVCEHDWISYSGGRYFCSNCLSDYPIKIGLK